MSQHRKLSALSMQELIEAFIEHNIACYHAMKRLDVETSNLHVDAIDAIDSEILRRGSEAWKNYAPLLRHDNSRVRLSAAVLIMRFDAARALPEIEALAQSANMDVRLDADRILYMWRKGEFPPKDESQPS